MTDEWGHDEIPTEEDVETVLMGMVDTGELNLGWDGESGEFVFWFPEPEPVEVPVQLAPRRHRRNMSKARTFVRGSAVTILAMVSTPLAMAGVIDQVNDLGQKKVEVPDATPAGTSSTVDKPAARDYHTAEEGTGSVPTAPASTTPAPKPKPKVTKTPLPAEKTTDETQQGRHRKPGMSGDHMGQKASYVGRHRRHQDPNEGHHHRHHHRHHQQQHQDGTENLINDDAVIQGVQQSMSGVESFVSMRFQGVLV
ncbi:hypothetical protein PV336_16395 [Streptomyces sp. MI02-2A]|uniref:hypothetical protein n=1 Tax=Streptomyces sp. MI02-2A TaxID=3028688 RepID=UPI0029B49561|nr:hypothetical protein [Streptomyces sp. MI02-2A]MDX3260802.1 hypothetical protein [Streptomyces sp. MI02-2A]